MGGRLASLRWKRLPVAATIVMLGLSAAGVLPAQEEGEEAAEGRAIEYSLEKPLAIKSLLLDGAAVEGLMVAVGERGHVLLSRDAGATWTQATVPTRASLTAVHLHDDQLGWVVGHDAVIMRTSDGGTTWELLHWAPDEERPFLDVWFRDADNGVAIGAYGYFLKTDDGGDSWSEYEIETEEEEAPAEDYYYYDDVQYHLNAISVAESGPLYIAAEAGNVYRSDDGGESWVTLASPYEGSYFGTLPLEGDAVILYGLRGHLFRSDDAGESWSELETGTQALLTNAARFADGTIVVVGMAGTVLVSNDGGATFALNQQEDREGLTAVLEAGDRVVLLGEFGVDQLDADDVLRSNEP